jgi:tetratricopeptide (TPR) repeat protein
VLWRQRVNLLKRLDRRDEAVAAMIRVVALDDDNNSLLELVDWLARERAWNSIDEVATRFTDRFQRDPILLYTLAQGCKSQGNDAAASKNAEKAAQLNKEDPLKHLRVAVQLQQRGWFDWSTREYRQVVKIGPGQSVALQAQFFLAEMQYDQGDYQAAVKTLEEATDTFKDKEGLDKQIAETSRTVNEALTRLHFFRACQYEAAGQRDRQLAELMAGFKIDPDDVDVLIALFNYPSLDAATREGVRKRIGQCAESFRQNIKSAPEEATAYNQLAWLIANTEGDKQEAIRASQKSLELRPESAGFLDTLARCCFAAGDLENAVKHQSRAVEIDSHSGQMDRQLKLFRDALAKRKQKP